LVEIDMVPFFFFLNLENSSSPLPYFPFSSKWWKNREGRKSKHKLDSLVALWYLNNENTPRIEFISFSKAITQILETLKENFAVSSIFYLSRLLPENLLIHVRWRGEAPFCDLNQGTYYETFITLSR